MDPTAAQAIRALAQATECRDVSARYRALRLATRRLPRARRLVPENPRGGGAEADRLTARHLTSLLLAFGAGGTPAGGPAAVRQLEQLPIEVWWQGDNLPDPDPDVGFMWATERTLRACVEYWLTELSLLSAAELDRLEARLYGAVWSLRMTTGTRGSAVADWKRLDPTPPLSFERYQQFSPSLLGWASDRVGVRFVAPETAPAPRLREERTVTIEFAPIAAAARLLAPPPIEWRRPRQRLSYAQGPAKNAPKT